jgi:hypothetical protein
MYILVAKSFLVYVSDAFTAVTMLSTNGWTNAIYNKCTDASQCVIVDFNVGKWVFVGCILFGYALVRISALSAMSQVAYLLDGTSLSTNGGKPRRSLSAVTSLMLSPT